MVDRWSNYPIFTARQGEIKVWPLYMEHPADNVVTDIVMGGCAPVTAQLNGVTCFTYFPSSVHSVNTNGDALFVVELNGVLCIDYKAAPYGVILGGEAPITVVLNGVTCYFYPATCGVTMGGEADVTFTANVKTRGGKGTPAARKRQQQATHHYYEAEAFFENTLVLGGEATATFTPAPYQFIKSLPKVPYKPKTDSEFVDLFKKLEAQPRTTTFSYQATGGVTATGKASDEYFDFTNFIIMHDEDVIIADILSTDGTPFITTSFDRDLKKLRRDDDDVIEIFELL
jgi:hypothetical protein